MKLMVNYVIKALKYIGMSTGASFRAGTAKLKNTHAMTTLQSAVSVTVDDSSTSSF